MSKKSKTKKSVRFDLAPYHAPSGTQAKKGKKVVLGTGEMTRTKVGSSIFEFFKTHPKSTTPVSFSSSSPSLASQIVPATASEQGLQRCHQIKANAMTFDQFHRMARETDMTLNPDPKMKEEIQSWDQKIQDVSQNPLAQQCMTIRKREDLNPFRVFGKGKDVPIEASLDYHAQGKKTTEEEDKKRDQELMEWPMGTPLSDPASIARAVNKTRPPESALAPDPFVRSQLIDTISKLPTIKDGFLSARYTTHHAHGLKEEDSHRRQWEIKTNISLQKLAEQGLKVTPFCFLFKSFLMQQSGTFPFVDPGKPNTGAVMVTWPGCVNGEECIGQNSVIQPHSSCPGLMLRCRLMSIMYPDEIKELVASGKAPREIRPCVLCHVKAVSDVLIFRSRLKSDQSLEGRILEAGYETDDRETPVIQYFSVFTGPGEHAIDHVFNSVEYPFIQGCFPRHNLLNLRVFRDPKQGNRIVVCQAGIQQPLPRPPQVRLFMNLQEFLDEIQKSVTWGHEEQSCDMPDHDFFSAYPDIDHSLRRRQIELEKRIFFQTLSPEEQYYHPHGFMFHSLHLFTHSPVWGPSFGKAVVSACRACPWSESQRQVYDFTPSSPSLSSPPNATQAGVPEDEKQETRFARAWEEIQTFSDQDPSLWTADHFQKINAFVSMLLNPPGMEFILDHLIKQQDSNRERFNEMIGSNMVYLSAWEHQLEHWFSVFISKEIRQAPPKDPVFGPEVSTTQSHNTDPNETPLCCHHVLPSMPFSDPLFDVEAWDRIVRQRHAFDGTGRTLSGKRGGGRGRGRGSGRGVYACQRKLQKQHKESRFHPQLQATDPADEQKQEEEKKKILEANYLFSQLAVFGDWLDRAVNVIEVNQTHVNLSLESEWMEDTKPREDGHREKKNTLEGLSATSNSSNPSAFSVPRASLTRRLHCLSTLKIPQNRFNAAMFSKMIGSLNWREGFTANTSNMKRIIGKMLPLICGTRKLRALFDAIFQNDPQTCAIVSNLMIVALTSGFGHTDARLIPPRGMRKIIQDIAHQPDMCAKLLSHHSLVTAVLREYISYVIGEEPSLSLWMERDNLPYFKFKAFSIGVVSVYRRELSRLWSIVHHDENAPVDRFNANDLKYQAHSAFDLYTNHPLLKKTRLLGVDSSSSDPLSPQKLFLEIFLDTANPEINSLDEATHQVLLDTVAFVKPPPGLLSIFTSWGNMLGAVPSPMISMRRIESLRQKMMDKTMKRNRRKVHVPWKDYAQENSNNNNDDGDESSSFLQPTTLPHDSQTTHSDPLDEKEIRPETPINESDDDDEDDEEDDDDYEKDEDGEDDSKISEKTLIYSNIERKHDTDLLPEGVRHLIFVVALKMSHWPVDSPMVYRLILELLSHLNFDPQAILDFKIIKCLFECEYYDTGSFTRCFMVFHYKYPVLCRLLRVLASCYKRAKESHIHDLQDLSILEFQLRAASDHVFNRSIHNYWVLKDMIQYTPFLKEQPLSVDHLNISIEHVSVYVCQACQTVRSRFHAPKKPCFHVKINHLKRYDTPDLSNSYQSLVHRQHDQVSNPEKRNSNPKSHAKLHNLASNSTEKTKTVAVFDRPSLGFTSPPVFSFVGSIKRPMSLFFNQGEEVDFLRQCRMFREGMGMSCDSQLLAEIPLPGRMLVERGRFYTTCPYCGSCFRLIFPLTFFGIRGPACYHCERSMTSKEPTSLLTSAPDSTNTIGKLHPAATLPSLLNNKDLSEMVNTLEFKVISRRSKTRVSPLAATINEKRKSAIPRTISWNSRAHHTEILNSEMASRVDEDQRTNEVNFHQHLISKIAGLRCYCCDKPQYNPRAVALYPFGVLICQARNHYQLREAVSMFLSSRRQITEEEFKAFLVSTTRRLKDEAWKRIKPHMDKIRKNLIRKDRQKK